MDQSNINTRHASCNYGIAGTHPSPESLAESLDDNRMMVEPTPPLYQPRGYTAGVPTVQTQPSTYHAGGHLSQKPKQGSLSALSHNHNIRLPTPPQQDESAYNKLLEWHANLRANDQVHELRTEPRAGNHCSFFPSDVYSTANRGLESFATHSYQQPQLQWQNPRVETPSNEVPNSSSLPSQPRPNDTVQSHQRLEALPREYPYTHARGQLPLPAWSYEQPSRQEAQPHFPVNRQIPSRMDGHMSQLPHSYAISQHPGQSAVALPSMRSSYLQNHLASPQISQSRTYQHVAGNDPRLPPIQNWSIVPTRHHKATTGHEGPTIDPATRSTQAMSARNNTRSPGQNGSSGLDKRSLRKQAAFRKKGDAKRRSISERPPQPTKQRNPKTAEADIDPVNHGLKRKQSPSMHNLTFSTLAPAQRHAHAPGFGVLKPEHLQLSSSQLNIAQNSMAQQIEMMHNPFADRIHSPYATHSVPVGHDTASGSMLTSVPPQIFDWDAVDQSIVDDYNNYKWSVKLYQVDTKKSGCYYANSWLQDQILALPAESVRNMFAHITKGFISSGTASTFVVLHNAADPWDSSKGPTTTTTTIGVYGYYWYEHKEIEWWTFKPGLRQVITQWEHAGLITEVQKWSVDMKPKEKRFHRAYWLCANRMRLGGILNSNITPSKPDDDVDMEDEVDVFDISESDLQSHKDWEVSDTEARNAWDLVVEESQAEAAESDHIAVWWSHE